MKSAHPKTVTKDNLKKGKMIPKPNKTPNINLNSMMNQKGEKAKKRKIKQIGASHVDDANNPPNIKRFQKESIKPLYFR